MASELETCLHDFEFADRQIGELVAGVDDGRFNQHPSQKSWSMAQSASTVDDFKSLQLRFVNVVQSADGLDLGRIKIASPALRLLRLSLGQWVVGLAGHQRRRL